MKNWWETIPDEIWGDVSPIKYTGAGEDGKVQPSNPIQMVQTIQGPRMIHEGEATMQLPNGGIQVVPQKDLKYLEMAHGIQGFQEGGTYKPDYEKNKDSGFKPQGSTPDPNTPKAEESIARSTGLGILTAAAKGESPVDKSVWNQAIQAQGGAGAATTGAMKQEMLQSGMSEQSIGTASAARASEVEGERSRLIGGLATATQERSVGAAQALASQGLAGKSFEEQIRQFDVGSDQWNQAFTEQRRQFDVGSDQWQQSFNEQRRQFDVGSDQWQKSFEEQRRQYDLSREDQREMWKKSFDEQRRQYDLSREDQLTMWNKSFEEERRQYDLSRSDQREMFYDSLNEQQRQYDLSREDHWKQWEKSFADSRERFDLTRADQLSQWNDTFALQKEQFEEGSDQWWAAHEQHQKEWAESARQWQETHNLQLDKFEEGSEQWEKQFTEMKNQFRATLDFKERQIFDEQSPTQQRLEMERKTLEAELKLNDVRVNAAEASLQSEKYWDAADKFSSYMASHLDAGVTDKNAREIGTEYLKAMYGEEKIDNMDESDVDRLLQSEMSAAKDDRLTNPISATRYQISSSDIPNKDQALEIFDTLMTNPELHGLRYEDGKLIVDNIEVDAEGNEVVDISSDTSHYREWSPKSKELGKSSEGGPAYTRFGGNFPVQGEKINYGGKKYIVAHRGGTETDENGMRVDYITVRDDAGKRWKIYANDNIEPY